MYITYWYGPPREETNAGTYEDVKNAGFTLAGPMECSGSTVEENLRFLDICQEQGLKACIMDTRMNRALEEYRNGTSVWSELLEAIAADYKHHPALHSYYIFDEPNSEMFPMLGAFVAKLRECDPEHPGYINLLPNYATPDQLGNETYYDHVKDYIEIVKPAFVSYDHYHFLHFAANEMPPGYEVEETEDERENAIRRAAMVNVNRAGFFENLEVVRELCKKYELPFMVIVLLIEHGPYRNVTESELRFEAFQSMAYGASMLSYFTYWTVYEPGSWWNWQNGCISLEGEKLQHYYDVQKVNSDVQLYAGYLEGKQSVCVSHCGETEEKVTPFAGKISSAAPVQLTVGEFEGGLTAIANKDFQNAAEFAMEFPCGAKMLDRTTNQFVAFDSQKIKIEAGDMVLIRTE